MTRWFRIPLTAAIVVAVVLLVAMAAGGANSTVFERYFPILLIVTSLQRSLCSPLSAPLFTVSSSSAATRCSVRE